MIIIDPVSAYLGGGDDNRNATVRGVLSPLKNLAERLQAAVVLISHLTKGTSASDKYRVAGSIAYVGASRANFLFVADPSDPAGRRVLMLDNGGNVAPQASPLAYTIDDHGKPGPRLRWSDEPVAPNVADAARAVGGLRDGDESPARDRCNEWLQNTLACGRVPAAELRRAGEAADEVAHVADLALGEAGGDVGGFARRDGEGLAHGVGHHRAAGHARRRVAAAGAPARDAARPRPRPAQAAGVRLRRRTPDLRERRGL